MSRATEQQLGELHGLVASTFADEIRRYVREKQAIPPSLLAAALKFLKDNGIDAPARDNDAVDKLASEIEDLDFDDPTVVAFRPRG
jgi:hypothetical protein